MHLGNDINERSRGTKELALGSKVLAAQTFERLGLRWQDFFLFCFAFGALVAIGVAVLREHNEISHSHARVSAAIIALQSSENVSLLLLRAETAQRGFLLTGSEAYLQPYRGAIHEMPTAIKDFERAVQEIHLDQGKGGAVPKLIASKLAEMAETIHRYRTGGPDRSTEVVRTNVGKRLMDQFVVKSNEVKIECTRVLTRESDQLRERNQTVLYITIIGFPTLLLTLVLTAIRLRTLFSQQMELAAQNRNTSEQYRLLAGHLDSVREHERAHLAREIHDVLGQALTVAKLEITMALRHIAPRGADLGTAVVKLEAALMSLDSMIKMVRQVAGELRPPLLDTIGLHATLRAYARELEEKTHLRIRFDSSDQLPPLTSKQNITAYRICQESLTNVVRHARADEVNVSLLCFGDGITLTIKDNGIGLLDQALESRRSFGLLGMQERAQLIDGKLAIHGEDGTTVILQFPVNGSKTKHQK